MEMTTSTGMDQGGSGLLPAECAAAAAAAAAFVAVFEQIDVAAFETQARGLDRRALADIIETITGVVGCAHDLLLPLLAPVSEHAGHWDQELRDGTARIEVATYELTQLFEGLRPQGTAGPRVSRRTRGGEAA